VSRCSTKSLANRQFFNILCGMEIKPKMSREVLLSTSAESCSLFLW
jgi:hypothetical protein